MSYQKRVDYAFRAVHMTAVEAKRIVAAYYARAAAYSYWDGCSTGGRQGLISAQRFPQDFDGIVAGAPVLNFVDTVTRSLWNGAGAGRDADARRQDEAGGRRRLRPLRRQGRPEGRPYRRSAPLRLRSGTRRAAVPGRPGRRDLSHAGTKRSAIKKIYERREGRRQAGCISASRSAPRWRVSARSRVAAPESGWNRWLIAPPNGRAIQHAYGESFVRYFLPKSDPNLDTSKFDFAKDMAKYADARALLNATNPDLGGFRARGGKLLMYFGWADTALPPLMAIDYYLKAVGTNGLTTPDFFRLFMVPGMFHCRGGVGTDRFDAMTALINWVENGIAPATIAASQVDKGKVVRTRPLCPYPLVARYSGSGSPDELANFACKAPE